MATLPELTPNSLVRDLLAHEYLVDASVSVEAVCDVFNAHQDLPGVIITNDGAYLGMVPRSLLLARLGRPYGIEIYLRRSIAHLFEQLNYVAAVLPADMSIAEAAKLALRRPVTQLSDPVAVLHGSGHWRVLDSQVLLTALSRLLELRNSENEALLANVRRHSAELQAMLEELRKAQSDLVQASKMASLAELVAGVAHEVNTPVGIAVTAASHLAEQTESVVRNMQAGALKRSDFERYLLATGETAQMLLFNLARASNLIRSFKQVATDETNQERRVFLLEEYLQAIMFSLRPQLKKTPHTVTVSCPPDLQMFSCPGAIAQIVTNLVMNAVIHAFPDEKPGQIALTVQSDGNSVELSCTDNGIGITAENVPRIFDPFFTTRRTAGGAGLGLHIVFNLVTWQLKGKIHCESRPGNGASFILQLPLQLPKEETHDAA